MKYAYLSTVGVIGAVIIQTDDQRVLTHYCTVQGKIFQISQQLLDKPEEKWIINLGGMTANSNLIRLKNGRLMTTLKKLPQDKRAKKLGGADFSVLFSADGGHTWGDERPVNKESGCYYLMNDRLLRLMDGRIIMPLCLHPKDSYETGLEKAGWCGCFFSDDEGLSWNESNWVKGETIDGHLAEPMVVEQEKGKLIMFMRTGRGYLYQSESTDAGATWSKESSTGIKSPCAPFAFKKDPFSGLFFLTWIDSYPAPIYQYPRCPLSLSVSSNMRDFIKIMDVDKNPMKSYGYPAFYFTPENINIAYYESPNRLFNAKTHKLKLAQIDRSEVDL